MAYVDGFVFVIKKKNIPAYTKMAKEAGKIWKKHGALEYMECLMDDPKPKLITFTFGKMTRLKSGETAGFSYIVYKSRKHRDQVNAKVMKEMDEKYEDQKDMPMPFDMKRMAYAGFKTIVEI
jgi:alkaline phosphatase